MMCQGGDVLGNDNSAFVFITRSEQCASQGVGVVGGWVWNMLIFHRFVLFMLCFEKGFGQHGVCEMGNVDMPCV